MAAINGDEKSVWAVFWNTVNSRDLLCRTLSEGGEKDTAALHMAAWASKTSHSATSVTAGRFKLGPLRSCTSKN